MSRPPRIISETGLYHIIFRGINRQDIFEENNDYKKLSDLIYMIKQEMKFKIYAYCFMPNHVHLFIKEAHFGDIKKIMHKMLTRYVMWYNFKYERSGSLIGNRYKSEPIEDEQYYMSLIRYIHQNPIKSGLSEDIGSYRYSSYNDYINGKSELVDIECVFSMFSEKKDEALKLFKEFHELYESEDFSISNSKKLTDEQLRRKLTKITKEIKTHEIIALPKPERNEIIRKLRKAGFSIRQLERLTGISKGIIEKVGM